MEHVYHPEGTELLRLIGVGSHASVYLMRCADGVVCAFKLFNRVTPAVQKQALRESRFLHHMSRHPVMQRFVPRFIAFSERPLYIQMEYIDGAVLDVRAMSYPDFERFIGFAAEFLTNLHQRFGLALRDVSPRNVLRCKDGFRFVDFEQVSEIGKPYQPQNAGTPRYAAPVPENALARPEDDFTALALICAERDAELPWRNLRDICRINAVKTKCMSDPAKYFAHIQHKTVRKWIFAFSATKDTEVEAEYIDYCTEFTDSVCSH